MSGLSENEKDFIKEFLKRMDYEDVRDIASIVTQHMGTHYSREDCVNAILLHSTSLDRFLQHKKVTKDKLFDYLNRRGISVPDKHKPVLQQKIKELVTDRSLTQSNSSQSPTRKNSVPCSAVYSNYCPSLEFLVRKLSSLPSISPPIQRRVVQQPVIQQPVIQQPVIQQPAIQQRFQQPFQPPFQQQFQQPIQQQFWKPIHLLKPEQFNLASTSHSRITITEERVTTTDTTTHYEHISVTTSHFSGYFSVISDFTNWFYLRVNKSEGLLSDDFWPDVQIKIKLEIDTAFYVEDAEGARDTARLLNKILEKYKLYLNPNKTKEGIWPQGIGSGLLQVAQGVCGQSNGRDLLVLVCGTLNQRVPAADIPFGQCLGKFENLFLLSQDPFVANNWRIKKLQVIFTRTHHLQQLPTVADSELSSFFNCI